MGGGGGWMDGKVERRERIVGEVSVAAAEEWERGEKRRDDTRRGMVRTRRGAMRRPSSLNG